jgi:hypothetical protein
MVLRVRACTHVLLFIFKLRLAATRFAGGGAAAGPVVEKECVSDALVVLHGGGEAKEVIACNGWVLLY